MLGIAVTVKGMGVREAERYVSLFPQGLYTSECSDVPLVHHSLAGAKGVSNIIEWLP